MITFDPKLLNCVSDDSADSSDSTFSDTARFPSRTHFSFWKCDGRRTLLRHRCRSVYDTYISAEVSWCRSVPVL